MKILEIIMYIIMVVSLYTAYLSVVIYNIHMFQLNYYKVKVQLNWIKKNLKKIFKKIFIIFAVILLANISIISFNNIKGIMIYIACIILLLMLGYINIEKKNKKKIIYTPRVMRILLTSTLIFSVAIILNIVAKYNINDQIIIMSILILFIPLVVIVANYINKPIEKLINKYYINDAKRVLKEMPNLIVIGVTGSYGKTSVKTYLANILSSRYNVLATPENYNTTLGVVRTIREKLRATHEIFICEMGATKQNDIKEICDLVHPKYGVITSIGEQHLESFKSIENIVKTKFELADEVSKQNGILFVNYDNEMIIEEINKRENSKQKLKVIKYGFESNDKKKEYYITNLDYTNNGINFEINIRGDKNKFNMTTKLLGKHNAINITAAIAVANTLGISMEKIKPKVRLLEQVPHRQELIQGNNCLIIDDAYNSNPNGAKSALETLDSFKTGVKILVTPGMIELGEKEDEYNYEFGRRAAKVCKYIFLVGEIQTRAIYQGIEAEDFDMNKVIVTKSLEEAMILVYKLNTSGEEKIILLENDLPDNY